MTIAVADVMLVIEGGAEDGKGFSLGVHERLTIGRHSANDIVVQEIGVSRHHAEICLKPDGYRLYDLASTNGVFVNRKRIGPEGVLLADGDRVSLGNRSVSLRFVSPRLETVVFDTGYGVAVEVDGPPTMSAEAVRQDEIRNETGVTDAVPPTGPNDGIYQGAIRLKIVNVTASMKEMLSFARHLSECAEFRVLRMINNGNRGVEVWVALRQPVNLRLLLSRIAEVAAVSPTGGRDLSVGGGDPPLTVVLKVADRVPYPSDASVPSVN